MKGMYDATALDNVLLVRRYRTTESYVPTVHVRKSSPVESHCVSSGMGAHDLPGKARNCQPRAACFHRPRDSHWRGWSSGAVWLCSRVLTGSAARWKRQHCRSQPDCSAPLPLAIVG